MANPPQIRVDVWSDYVCPFCYLHVPQVQRLKEQFRDQLAIVWRAFELRPEPRPTLEPNGEYLRTTWERSVYPLAKQRGMTLKLPPVQPRSRKALETVAFAESHLRFHATHESIFKAFFEDGRDIGDPDVLCKIGTAAGLDAADLRQALAEGRHTTEVVDDEVLALNLGITGVPITLVRAGDAPWEQAVALSGTVPYETLEAAVRQVIADSAR
jgi:predicted DsbA family dithiol-disulfide isomerase